MRGALLRAGLLYPGEHPDITKRRDDRELLALRLAAARFEKDHGATPDTEAVFAIPELDSEFLYDKLALFESDSEYKKRVDDEIRQIREKLPRGIF